MSESFRQLLQACLQLGLPVALLSTALFYQFYEQGDLDRDADQKTTKASLKKIKKSWKQRDKRLADIVHNKWMKFGGGFYGIAALWTFIAIEFTQFLSFVTNFDGFGHVLDNCILSFLIQALINQIQNFITAIIWFTYWGGEERSIFIWVIVAYCGYKIGTDIAKRPIIKMIRELFRSKIDQDYSDVP